MGPILLSLTFMIVNVVVLYVILRFNRRLDDEIKSPNAPSPAQKAPGELDASDILGWEFQYAQSAASEAMEQRHTLVNFYLLVAGVAASAVAAILGGDLARLRALGAVLLWVLCGIGWLYFLAIIRLRQAWHDSARAMNQIKEFYIQHTREFKPDVLRTAFRWKDNTLPPAEKAWTVFFYSAMVVSFIDSVAYVGGGMLLGLDEAFALPFPIAGVIAIFGLIFFAFHVWLYFAFLKPRSDADRQEANPEATRESAPTTEA
jgi:hypothetical protein